VRLAASVNRLENGHDAESADCAIISLGCYLGIPYPEMLRAATLSDKDAGRDGLTVRTIKRMAASYGAALVHLRRFDPDEDYGLVVTPDHCAVLRNGLVFDRLTVWEWADWLVNQRIEASQCVLLVVKE
jgi:hypothetical protein